ncbi:MAG: ATPase, partial [Croceibacterium sp.]
MADSNRLRAIGAGAPNGEPTPTGDPASLETLVLNDEYVAEPSWDDVEYEDDAPRTRRLGWLVPLLAILAVAGWTGFFAWVNRGPLLAGASPLLWSRWIVDWSVPVVLVIGLWLLAMRNSRREAGRFADAASALSHESAQLETRLSAVNRELSLARDFIAAQSRDLESLGRVAAERLSHNADRLQGLIRDNGEQVEAIGRVSSTALANMDRLRDDLPVISNSARDVTSQIANAGETARHHLDELVGGFDRLNEFGEASGRQVAALRGKVEQAIAAF